jgi:hypothetical protein
MQRFESKDELAGLRLRLHSGRRPSQQHGGQQSRRDAMSHSPL